MFDLLIIYIDLLNLAMEHFMIRILSLLEIFKGY